MAVGTFDCWPRKVVSGPGSLLQVGDLIRAMDKTRVIVFTDSVIQRLPVVVNLIDRLKSQGFSVSVFADIGPNPTEKMVHDAVDFMRGERPEVIVGIGGGSPIDAGKAANVVYTHGGNVKDYDIAANGIARITPKLLPYIAVPTTAGTGSEVTFVGVITDTGRQTKFGVLSPLLIPDVAVLDPEVTVSMPPGLTAATGVDALTHCIEAYTSAVGFPPADALALHGTCMISRSLRAAVNDGRNLEAREEMLVASMMAGTAFSLNGLGICHAMAHQLSAFFDMPHGMANAILLPRIMRFNLPANVQKFARIAEAMGLDTGGMSLQEAAEKAVEMVEQLSNNVGLPRYLDDAGGTKDGIPGLVERAMADPVHRTNPRPVTPADVEDLFRRSFR
ncbi:MAG: iron-containing alcohol dehydrogenase family protein [Bacillota bacterium]